MIGWVGDFYYKILPKNNLILEFLKKLFSSFIS